MSHITRIQTKMVEAELVKAAIRRLGYPLVEGPTTVRGDGGREAQCDFKFETASYPVGFKRGPSGMEAVGDFYYGGRAEIKKLTQQYARLATLEKLEEQGFSVVEETDKEGVIRLTLERLVYA